MCEPATVLMLTTAVVSAAMAARSANQQKHAVEAQAQAQQQQANEAASAQMQDRMAAARQARASARAAAAEAGASGNSTAAQLNDFMQQSATDVARIEKNRQNGNAETSIAARSRFTEINGQLTSSLVGSAAQAGGAYMNHREAVASWAAQNPIPVNTNFREQMQRPAYYGVQNPIAIDRSKYTIKG